MLLRPQMVQKLINENFISEPIGADWENKGKCNNGEKTNLVSFIGWQSV